MRREPGSEDFRAETRPPSRAYGMIVVALTVFFAGLLLWRTSIQGFLVTAEIACEGAREQRTGVAGLGGPSNETLLEPVLTSSQNIADAIRFADQVCQRQSAGDRESLPEATVREVARRLDVRVQSMTGAPSRIRITYRGQDADWSIALVERVTRSLLVSSGAATVPREVMARDLRTARWRVDEQRHYERKARLDLEGILDMHFEQVASHTRGNDLDTVGWDPNGAATADAAAVTSDPNPDWQRLQDESAELAQQLQALLARFTPNHPQVQDLAMRMESVQRQLDETPRYGGPLSPGSWPAVREASVSGGGVATATAEWPVGPAVSAGMTRSVPTQESYRQLREWYDDAVRRREAAEDALAGLLDGQLATDARANATLRWLVTPAHVAEKVGGKPSGRRVCVLAILALVWGAGMAWFIGALRGLRNVHSAPELEQLVAIPLVGQLSIDPLAQSVRRLWLGERVARWTITACEFALGTLVVVFIVAALDHGPTLAQLARDPFGTVTETVVSACEKWL